MWADTENRSTLSLPLRMPREFFERPILVSAEFERSCGTTLQDARVCASEWHVRFIADESRLVLSRDFSLV